MTRVLLIYPYFKPARDRSVFRFPPLGVSYIAASLQQDGHAVSILDCTFLRREEALERAFAAQADAVGIYCMVTMMDDCLWFARELRSISRLLLVGGPLPTCDPLPFLEHFDVVVRGEGEQTAREVLRLFENGEDFSQVSGIATQIKQSSELHAGERIVLAPPREFERNLDTLPFPARQLLPNQDYIKLGKKKYGYAITTVMSTRGCPYHCEFCSNVVFGGSYRERSPGNVVDEIEEALKLGYDRISFGDDVFTMKRSRVLGVCEEIERHGLSFQWECLGRVDAIEFTLAGAMKKAGCTRIYFGIESGNDEILELMDKKITTGQARAAVEAAHRAGLETGAFFILFYPGDTQETVLKTLRFATSLPLDYLGLTLPYPLPGTALHERIKDRITRDWHPGESVIGGHSLIFNSEFSAFKMEFGILKGQAQMRLNRRLGRQTFLPKLFERFTDWLFTRLK